MAGLDPAIHAFAHAPQSHSRKPSTTVENSRHALRSRVSTFCFPLLQVTRLEQTIDANETTKAIVHIRVSIMIVRL
jgi:hypothetical protein